MKRSLLTAVALLAAITANAQQKVLTIEEASEIALSGNKSITASQHNIAYYEKMKKVAGGLRSPKFDFNAAYTYMANDISIDLNSAKSTVMGIAGQLQPQEAIQQFLSQAPIQGLFAADWSLPLQKRDFAVLGFTAEVPIFTGGKINIANRVAKMRINESQHQSEQTKEGIFTQLVERYYGLSLALQVVDTRREVLEGMKKHLEDAISLESNGIIARVEKLYAQMHVASAQKDLNIAETNVRTIMQALNNTLGSDEVNYTPVSTLFVLGDIKPVSYYKNLAMEGNRDLQQVAIKEQMARQAVKLEQAAYFPQLAAMGGYNAYSYQLTHLVPKWVVGAGLKFTIFDGLQREHKISAAKQKVKYVEAAGSKAKSDITTLVEKLYNELQSNVDIITSLDAAIEFNREYLRIKSKAFSEGTATSTDVVDARLLLAKSKVERLQAAYNYDVAFSKLLEACGQATGFLADKNGPSYKAVIFEAQ